VYLKYCYKKTFTVYCKRRRSIFAHYFIHPLANRKRTGAVVEIIPARVPPTRAERRAANREHGVCASATPRLLSERGSAGFDELTPVRRHGASSARAMPFA
jgi:hypothetical protein